MKNYSKAGNKGGWSGQRTLSSFIIKKKLSFVPAAPDGRQCAKGRLFHLREKRKNKFMPKGKRKNSGFTLIEILVVIGIISLMSAIILVAVNSVRYKARDARRKAEISQIGRFLAGSSCYMPDAGTGDYDIIPLIEELKTKYPQYASYISTVPRDPRKGTDAEAFYRYTVSANGKCALYANLENENEPITITNIFSPTAGGGVGVLEAFSEGWNNTKKYFQYSN